ncbi:MAG: hypothetical protein PHQ58_16315 [Rhodoferax sp.]|uniref:hypothetical protein n=1 Tax=Rhodoferax sp. TaxID=50421 RepID=UPI00262DAAA0|nr:hypothetical protein [Rhodoferax sp.]MDD2881993.1 hypothetical protein [Rhodoferax sp.]
MNDDDRCCGTGTCIIDANGHCWCGQQWDGEKMCHPDLASAPEPKTEKPAEPEPLEPTQPREPH